MSEGHVVIQVWSCDSVQYFRCQFVDDSHLFLEKLHEIYKDNLGDLHFFFYKLQPPQDFYDKVGSYIKIFFNGQVKESRCNGILLQLAKECKKFQDIVKDVEAFLDEYDEFNFNMMLKYVREPNEGIVSLKEIPKQMNVSTYDEVLQNFSGAFPNTHQVSLTVHKYETSTVAEFPVLIGRQTLMQIIKVVLLDLHNLWNPQEILDAFDFNLSCNVLPCKTVIHIDKDICLPSNAIDISIQDVLEILKTHLIGECDFKTHFSELCEIVLGMTKCDTDTTLIHYSPLGKLTNVQPLNPCACKYAYLDNSMDDTMDDLSSVEQHGMISSDPLSFEHSKHHPFRPDPPRNLKTKHVVTDRNEIQPHDNDKIIHSIVVMKNLCNNQKSLFKVNNNIKNVPIELIETAHKLICVDTTHLDELYNMIVTIAKDLKNSMELSQNKLDTQMKQMMTHMLFALICNVFDDLIIPEKQVPTQESRSHHGCTCTICCTRGQLDEISQHTLIEHFVYHSKIQKDNGSGWCMASDIIKRLEYFFQKVQDMLPKIQIKLNKTAISQSLAEFLEKKRRVAGMTFSCKLPSENEVRNIAACTVSLIKSRISS